MDFEDNHTAPVSGDEETEHIPISEEITGGSKADTNGSPSPARKGHGLKKWRRVKRDNSISKGGNSSDDTGMKMVAHDHEESNLVTNPSKRPQVFTERPQKSEGSVSSPNPVFAVGPLSLDAGTDSENSEDFSSKWSAANVQKTRSRRGKNVTQQGKSLVFDSTKKVRGVRIEKEKEKYRSSMESDTRSLNFAFMEGTNGTSNGPRSEGRENGGHGYEENSADYLGGSLSWDADKRGGEKHDNSSDEDLLAESILVLQKAQEALEQEVLKFKEIGKDALVDGLVSDTHLGYTNESNDALKHFPSDECLQTTKREMEAELEDLFKQRIKAEVEYLAISRTFQKLMIGDESFISNEQKSTDSELPEEENKNKLEDNENGRKTGDKLREEIESVGETMNIQKKACKYTLYFLVQLLIVFGVFLFRLSPSYVEVVPT